MKFVCSKCGSKEDVSTRKHVCQCGGLWDLEYTPPKYNQKLINDRAWGMLRYASFMPLEERILKQITLGEGMTPIVSLDEHVLLKMDYMMPTLSFKDRGAAVVMGHCLSINVESVVQDSSGNAGNSMAAYAAKAGITCEIFVPEGTSHKKIKMIESHRGKVNVVKGSRDDCADVCRQNVIDKKTYYASHVYNPFFYEGTKTYIYEVYEQLGRIPEMLFVPVGNGTLFLGIVKGLEELLSSGVIDGMPKIIAVQSEKCCPIYEAYRNNHEITKYSAEKTFAEGIAIGLPMRGDTILDYIKRYGMAVILAPEDKILEARERLSNQGIYVEHTTAAIYAAYLEYTKKHKQTECLISMCGAGIKSDH